MCSWTLPCVSSLVPSVLHLSHGFQCSLHIEPPALRRKATTDKLVEKIVKHDSWPIQSDILSPPLLRLTSRKPLWLDLQPVDIKSRWRHNWKLTQVVNSHLVCDPTIQQPGFHLPLQHWSLLNRFCMEQGHCSACGKKWRLTDTDLCPCGETQTMFHIVESCPLTKLNGGLSQLHSADEDSVLWMTSYGLWHAYEKKKRFQHNGNYPSTSNDNIQYYISASPTNTCLLACTFVPVNTQHETVSQMWILMQFCLKHIRISTVQLPIYSASVMTTPS